MLEIRELVLKAVVNKNVKKKSVVHTEKLKINGLNHYQIQQLIHQQRER
ncbi:hypothetical protein HWQ46_09735 [Shewanella sp. D64]|jgi:hypothetical protein|nr:MULTISPECIES: hypothetical protein [unclassified Shewanella]MEC4725823.1 hypothetical protein [Shewanella sp. D64]MEC4737570.1 hypothetical protein [Shewanella sp. E94]WBJ93388.1 hypothetical protein HWQ47_15750 [Shewanella sp. MTB7]